MSVITDTKQQELKNTSKAVRRPVAAASRKSDRKAPGTRVGTVEDWRGGDTNATRETSPRGKTFRDGR